MTKQNNLRRGMVYLLSFGIPAGVLLWLFMKMGMAPWGDRTILISDMADQYVEFFCALKQGDLFFSWSKTMGTSYIGVFSYYVSSPLSLLTLLAPNENMPVALMFLTVLKLGLAGLSYAVFSTRKFPSTEITTVLCASCYGLMSYNIAFSLSIMWLDGVIWLPLILLALERVLEGRGAGPFIAALTVCFVSTWYISYMTGIFCCVYLTVRLITLQPDRDALLQVFKRFFGGAACALGLTAWLWLPTFLAMFYGKFQESGWHFSRMVYGPLSGIFSQLRPGQLATVTSSGLPNIFCGTLVVILCVIYFFLRAVPLREKLASAGALAFLFLSLWSTVLDRIWHLFKYPNWFPFRWSFVVSFFLIYLANRTVPLLLDALKEEPRPLLAKGLAAAFLLLTVGELHYNAETLLNVLDGIFHYQSYGAYWDYYTANAQLVDLANTDSGGAFCRMNSAEDRGHNAPLSFGYPGVTHYSSVYNTEVNDLLHDLGLAQAWFWCSGYGSTPVTDALFNIRYTLSPYEMPGYELLGEVRGLKLWKNPDVLPLAFLQPEKTGELGGDTPFDRQNDLISRLLGEEQELFTPVPAVAGPGLEETSFTFLGTGKPVYADLSAQGIGDVLVNGETILTLGRSEQMSIHYICTPAAGEVCTVAVRHEGDWTGELWELDQAGLHEAVERLNNTRITSVERDGTVRLTAQSGEGQVLATTIPAENGWKAYVDGQEASTSTWLNGAFMAVFLPQGTHQIELRYTAPGLVPGAALGAVSALSLVALALLPFFFGKKKGSEKRNF